MKKRNQNPRSKTIDCLLHSDVTVSAMLSVILQGMVSIFQIIYVLFDIENFVLSHGLNFGLPPKYLCKEEIFAKSEKL